MRKHPLRRSAIDGSALNMGGPPRTNGGLPNRSLRMANWRPEKDLGADQSYISRTPSKKL